MIPRRRLAWAGVMGLALAAGCASPPLSPESTRDPTADFAGYRTFGWASPGGVGDAEAPLMLLDRDIRNAIAAGRNAEVWQARISGRDTKGGTEPAAIATAVSTAIRDFPARTAP